jgi:hypothetical protein
MGAKACRCRLVLKKEGPSSGQSVLTEMILGGRPKGNHCF